MCAIKHLKGDKVAGPDGLIPELVKHSTLVEMFNQRIVILFVLTIFVLQVCLNHGRKPLFTHYKDKKIPMTLITIEVSPFLVLPSHFTRSY